MNKAEFESTWAEFAAKAAKQAPVSCGQLEEVQLENGSSPEVLSFLEEVRNGLDLSPLIFSESMF